MFRIDDKKGPETCRRALPRGVHSVGDHRCSGEVKRSSRGISKPPFAVKVVVV